MGSVYIFSDYGKLGKKEESLCFTSYDGMEMRIFLHRTDRIIITGAVEMSSAAFRMLMKHKIDTIFLSKNGKFNGKIEFQEGRNVFLRKRQYQILDNEAVGRTLAASIIHGKIQNQINFMQRIGRKKNVNSIDAAIAGAKKCLDDLNTANTMESLRGYEGYASRLFFSVLKQNISPDWARFAGRSMHPPKDEVNAVLSFIYTLLLYRVDSYVEMVGLDPYVGYLHTLSYGKRALTFDLMEEYRTSIADTLCCALFNLGVLNKSDFSICVFSADDDNQPLDTPVDVQESTVVTESAERISGVLLTSEGLKKVSSQFEEKMSTLIFYPPTAEKISYQQVMIEQVKHFSRVLMGEETVYKPFVVR
jgi:CRISPR-associated protein Cas1